MPKKGAILDIGCGFGLWIKLLMKRRRGREVWGVDPDHYKIKVARGLLVGTGVRLCHTLSDLPKTKKFILVTILDVLYLLPEKKRKKILQQAFDLLVPGGKLLIAFVPRENSWRYFLAWIQEWLMVNALAKTHTTGAIDFETLEWMRVALTDIGFEKIHSRILPTPWPWWHKHVLMVAVK